MFKSVRKIFQEYAPKLTARHVAQTAVLCTALLTSACSTTPNNWMYSDGMGPATSIQRKQTASQMESEQAWQDQQYLAQQYQAQQYQDQQYQGQRYRARQYYEDARDYGDQQAYDEANGITPAQTVGTGDLLQRVKQEGYVYRGRSGNTFHFSDGKRTLDCKYDNFGLVTEVLDCNMGGKDAFTVRKSHVSGQIQFNYD